MRIALRFCLGWLIWALLLSAAAGRDIYVNNLGGDDTFSGRQSESMADLSGPVRSIAKALRLAQQGDRIVLENTGQAYRESVSLVGSRHSGYSFQRFVIAGNGAILDGSAPVPAEAWEHYQGLVYRFRPPQLAHQQLFLNEKPIARVAVSGSAGEPPELEPLQWCLHGGYIYFRVEKMKLPEDYPLTYTHKQVGITLFHVRHVSIIDLTVQGFQLDGINAYNSAREVYIGRVTCRGNARSGIAIGGASLVEIEDCLIGDNGRAQLLSLPWSETHVRNCELLSNTAPAVVDQGGRVYIDGKRNEGGSDAR